MATIRPPTPPHPTLLLLWVSVKAVLLIQDANKEANCLGLITLLVARNAQKLPAERNTPLIFMVFFSGSWFGTDGKHSIFRVELYIDKEINSQLYEYDFPPFLVICQVKLYNNLQLGKLFTFILFFFQKTFENKKKLYQIIIKKFSLKSKYSQNKKYIYI